MRWEHEGVAHRRLLLDSLDSLGELSREHQVPLAFPYGAPPRRQHLDDHERSQPTSGQWAVLVMPLGSVPEPETWAQLGAVQGA